MLLVRFVMDEKKVSKSALSGQTGIEMARLEPIVAGVVAPTEAQAKAIADALGYEKDAARLFEQARGLYCE